MFGAFTDKVKAAFGVKLASVENVAQYNTAVDHDGISTATIYPTSNSWDKAKDNMTYIRDGIVQSVGSHFGSIAHCTKSAENDNATNTWNDIKAEVDAALGASKDFPRVAADVERFIGSGFEAATDEFVGPAIHDDDADAFGSSFKAISGHVTTKTWSDYKIASLMDSDEKSFVDSEIRYWTT